MSTADFDRAYQDKQADRARDWANELADIPEPAELTAQSAAIKADKEHLQQRCADCGQPRWGHGWKASTGAFGNPCPFVEPCPNADDPVLCKVQEDGVFVPEAGCAVHDPDVTP